MANNYQGFKKDLFNPKKSKDLLFYKLKSKFSFLEQIKTIHQIPRAYHTLLYGQPLFKTEDAFGKEKLQYEETIDVQLNWYCHLFKFYSSEINAFLKLKTKFETNFLIGAYNEARIALNEIQSSISFSYWGLENMFLLTQYERGLEFNFKLLNECKAKTVVDATYFIHSHFFSYKVEEDISFFSYENSLNNHLKHFDNSYKEYFRYRFNSLEYNYENLEGVLQISTKNSLIDRYILYRDIIPFLCSDPTYVEKTFDQIKFIQTAIDDTLLIKASNFIELEFSAVISIDSKKSISIIDLYTEGQYEVVITAAKEYLINEPGDFGVLETYVKAHIMTGKNIERLTIAPSILNRIATLMYDYLKKEGKTLESFVDLLTIANAISSFDFQKSLLAFFERNLQAGHNTDSHKSFLYSKTYNPAYYQLFRTNKEKLKFLDILSACGESKTVAFFRNLINDSPSLIENFSIPLYRRNFYLAQNLIEKERFSDAKLLLQSIIDNCLNVGFFQEGITNYLFLCYCKLGEDDQAISLYVRQFLVNSDLVSKIDAKDLSNRIVGSKFRKINHANIDLPVFVYLTHDEAHAKFIAYDLYMRSIRADKPTQIQVGSPLSPQLIYFLRYIATPKIISKKALIFKNSSDVLKERIAICQILFKADSTATSEYSKEISEITQRLTVQQRIKEIDQSMIYVDENGIINHELGEINKSFTRFRNISELLKSNKMDATGINFEALYSLVIGKIDNDTYKRSLRKTNIHFELFEQLYLEIRDKFLFSNHYGLDYYLSQRIRHGTIIGQLRKHFQEFNLVTSKSVTEGNYIENKFWSKILQLDEKQERDFQYRMGEFSLSVDKIILDLKDKYIQIKTEDPKTTQQGWFDYMFIPEWDVDPLYRLFLSKIQYVTDFNEFVNLIFEILWNQTTGILESIRLKIETGVKVNIISILDDLEIDLVDILGKDPNKSIFKNIADCRTSVQEDVDSVVRWFNKSKSDEVDFTIADAFNTSLTIVNNINSPFVINFDEDLETSTLFKGKYFTHFVDLLKILITNIFNYYQENSMLNLAGVAKFTIIEEILHITFSNILSNTENLSELQAKIDELKKDLNKSNYKAIRGEGNTGFTKANNVLKNVFRNNSNEIRIELEGQLFITKCLININNLKV